ncbi:MAG: ABC transporter substrate-binding protein [Alphaproteobacteria bacterium]|jgi:ABC-type branched-subunit amino acid transport system substrate-binding protein|nr:ABC transporter substrate-binding protein [Alphaproteobacteria bacterium]MDP6517215.1 ABC transporter substrate-binding protein [Alphaproteobacteria bacterium]
MINRRTTLAVAAALGLALASASASAAGKYDVGADDTTIKIGNTNPYSGPASSYGTIGHAISAFFDMVNDQGGINGRKIDFVTLDDGYSPPKTVEQVRKLVEQEEVLFLFQTLGTPTNSAIHKYVNAKGVPHLFVATGATKWGQPDKYPWTMGWQPTYTTEGKIYARYILDNIPDAKIGILFQNDDYGKDYVTGIKMGLGDRVEDLIVAELPYEVTDPTVDSQIVSLKSSGANVFYNVTIPKFAAQAIRKAYDIGWKPVHFLNSVSASVKTVLEPAGLNKAEGILSTIYLKDPTDPQWADSPDFQAWSKWMDDYYPDGNKGDTFNGYAYAVANTLAHVLERCGDDLTRANLMKVASSITALELPMMLPGITITTGPDDFYPLEQMQMVRFNGVKWEEIGEVLSAF